MLLEKILQIVKSPIFLVGLSVVSVVVIYVVVTRSPKTVTVTLGPKCPSGSFQITCLDGTTQCAQNCPVGQQWDCESKKCICSDNNKLCEKNTQCCDPCDNDMCCSSSNQITVNGVNSCCPPGTLPSKLNASSTTNDICLAACGNTTCGEGEACIKVTNLIPSTYDKFVTQPNVNGSYKDPTNASNNWITFCSNPDACTFGDENSLPNSIGNNNPYYNFDTYTQPGNKFGLCINSTATSNDTSCYGITDQTDCGNNPSCKWAVLPDDYDSNGPVGTQVQNYMNYKNGVNSSGYYCDPGGLSLGKLVHYQASSGNCTWQSCVSQILNQGTVDVDWNDATQTCTAFKVPPYQNIGYQPQQQKQCIGEGNPVKSCKSKNDFVNVIQCTAPKKPCGNCEQAGDYIYIGNGDTCQPVSDNNNWVFNECVPNDSNGNAVRVLGPKDSNGNGGNCPWGCSTPNKSEVGSGGGNCYNTDIPTGSGNIFGDNSIYPGSSGNVCLGNGQIVPQPTNPPITYFYDKSKFVCSQGSSSNPQDQNYNTLCECVNDIHNGIRSVSLHDNSSNFLIYQKTTDGTRWYMYYDPSRRWFEYTSDINNDKLKQYNQSLPGNLNFYSDGTGKVLLNGYSFGIGYEADKFQFCGASDNGPLSTTNIIGGNNSYASALLKDIDNKKILNYNFSYQFTFGMDTYILNNTGLNQTLIEEGSYTGLPNLTPEPGNYIYLTYYAIENQKAKQC